MPFDSTQSVGNNAAGDVGDSVTLVAGTCLLVLVTGAAFFLPHQSLWVDETTQLSGLTLSPVEQVQWLAGEDPQRFGVPGDRMPPLSYWLGWGWSRTIGLSELSMRCFSIIAAALGCVATVLAGATVGRRAGAWTAGLLYATSPNVVEQAVYIRPYPFLLAFSACALWAYVKGSHTTGREQTRWMSLLVAAAVAAAYTHFFGLIVGGALLVSWIVANPDRRRTACIAGVVWIVLVSGLIPFVLAADGDSGGSGWRWPALQELVRYVYRALVGHPAVAVYAPVALVALVAFVLTMLLALLPRPSGARVVWGLASGIVAGSASVLLVYAFVREFEPLAPSYNLWRLPMLCVLASAAVTLAWPGARRLAIALICLMVAIQIFGTVTLARKGPVFANSASDRVIALIESLDREGLTLILPGDEDWGYDWFPIHYHFGASLDGTLGRIEHGRVVLRPIGGDKTDEPVPLPGSTLLVVRSRPMGSEDLSRVLRSAKPGAIRPHALVQAIADDSRWRLTQHEIYPATRQSAVWLFQPIPPSLPAAH